MKYCYIFFLASFFMIFIPFFSFSQWTNVTTINTAICTKTNNQDNYSIETDSKGGAFIVWADNRNNILKADIYAQRINSLGYLLWNSQEVAVCTNSADQANPSTVADGNGGLIIAWDDSINGNRDIYAQKLDSSGNIKWAFNGVPVVVKTGKQKDVKIVTDGSGGAIAVWADSNNGYWDIYAQRINSSGVQMWINGGVPICIAAMNQKNPRILSDGLGGAIITWQDKRNAVDYDIYAQHINANGTALFVANGVLICNAIDKQTDPKIVSDNLGGAIIVWQDRRGGTYYDVYAQRINSAGNILWTTNGVAVCTADSSQTTIDITSENINGAIITWRDKRNGIYHDIYAQKVNLNGTCAWQLNGIPITTALLTQTNPNICADGSGGAIISWQDSTTGNWDIKAQRVNAIGTLLWNTGGNIVSDATNLQTNPKNLPDGKGGCIFVWKDFRNGIDNDIYAQHFNVYGIESYNMMENRYYINLYPNPASDNVYLEFNNSSNSKYFVYVFDVFGKIITNFETENDSYLVSVKDFNNGLYIIKVYNQKNLVYINKLCVKK